MSHARSVSKSVGGSSIYAQIQLKQVRDKILKRKASLDAVSDGAAALEWARDFLPDGVRRPFVFPFRSNSHSRFNSVSSSTSSSK
jgi:hypothetical protein